jgi:GTPase SAR1 family protein
MAKISGSEVGGESSGPGAGPKLPPGVTLRHVLSGHTDIVTSVAFHPQGGTLASGSFDDTVKLWDVASGRLLRSLDGHEGSVFSVAFDPQGGTLASGSVDQTVKLWDVASGRLLRTLEGHIKAVFSVAFGRQGGTLASGSRDNTVKLWDVASGRLLRTLEGHTILVWRVAFDPQGGTLASGSHDWTVKLWDVASGRLLRSLEEHHGTVHSVAFDPKGGALASGGGGRTVKLWDVASGRLLRTLEGHTGHVEAIAFSPDGTLLASRSSDHTVRLWSCATWETVAIIPVPTREHRWIPALAFHPDAQRERPLLATASSPLNTPEAQRCREIHLYELDREVLLRGTGFQPVGKGRAGSKLVGRGLEDKRQAGSLSHGTSNYRNAKVVLVGNTSVGKSGLGLVLSGRKFRATESTHGRHIWNIETPAATVEGITETRDTLLWDLAGQPGYRQVHQLHLGEVAIALVLFDSRSETQPFDGVAYWARALDAARQNEFPLKKFLVASRIDRSGTAVSQSRIDEIVKRFGFDGYFATSAKRGDGVDELRAAIEREIAWGLLPAVSRTTEFQVTKAFLVARKKRGVIIEEAEVLLRELLATQGKRGLDGFGIDAEKIFRTCLGQLEATGMIRRLPFGDWVLLQPEMLDDYCGWMTLAAREQPDGLGYLREDRAQAGDFPMDEDRPLANGRRKEEQTILIAAIEETLSRGLAVRETSARDRCAVLVFPAELREELPEYPGGYSLAVRFRFNGPVRGIYASLVVRLIHSMEFEKHELHKNAALFQAKHDGHRICGLAVDYPNPEDDSLGRLTVFFDDNARSSSKTLFLQYINSQLEAMAFRGSIEGERIYHCAKCEETIESRWVEVARRQNRSFVSCPVCLARFPLDDLVEEARQPNARIKEIDRETATAQRLAALKTTFTQRRDDGDFDVFLCHNARDKPAVRALAETLGDLGLLAWIDEEQLLPGDVVQEKSNARSVVRVRSWSALARTDSVAGNRSSTTRSMSS